jgi:hypothetical protein
MYGTNGEPTLAQCTSSCTEYAIEMSPPTGTGYTQVRPPASVHWRVRPHGRQSRTRRMSSENHLRDVSNPLADRVWREARRPLVLRHSGVRRRQLLGQRQPFVRPRLIGLSVHHLPIRHVRGLRLRVHPERRWLRHHGGWPLRYHVRVERCASHLPVEKLYIISVRIDS